MSRTPSPTNSNNNPPLGSPLGSQGTPSDKIKVTVTTSQSIEMIDKPSYSAFVKLEDQTTSFAAQGTVVNPIQHMTQACKRSVDMTLTMQDHANAADWTTLRSKDLFKTLKEIFPKASDASDRDIYKLCSEEAKNFNFDIFNQAQLVEAFVSLLQKLEGMTIATGDVKQTIKQLTRDILNGVGGTSESKRFLVNEVEKEKPLTLEAFFQFILKTQHDTKKVALEAKRRGILPAVDNRQIEGLDQLARTASSLVDPNLKRPRTESTPPIERSGGLCNGCGRLGHKWKDCIFVKFKHPDCNLDPTVAWVDSHSGIAWKNSDETYLPSRKKISKTPFDFGPLNEALKRK